MRLNVSVPAPTPLSVDGDFEGAVLAGVSWRTPGATHDELVISEEGFDEGTVVKDGCANARTILARSVLIAMTE
jgi:hypothetical protein